MAAKSIYVVHRAMHGDGRDYERGDTRQLSETDAAPLVASGALSLKGEEPIAPEAGVRHLFGTGESDAAERGYTTATGAGVVAGQPAGVAVRKVPGKAVATPPAASPGAKGA